MGTNFIFAYKILRACLDPKCNNSIKYCPDTAISRPGTHFCIMRSKEEDLWGDKEIAFLKYLNEIFL